MLNLRRRRRPTGPPRIVAKRARKFTERDPALQKAPGRRPHDPHDATQIIDLLQFFSVPEPPKVGTKRVEKSSL
jgi:hypothetical protein